METIKRVEIEFSEQAWQELEALRVKANEASNAEVVRKALAVYDWLLSETKPTDTIQVNGKNGDPVFRITAKAFLFNEKDN